MIDVHGTLKIIDFGSIKIIGLEEITVSWKGSGTMGALNYTAPECLQGYPGPGQADLYYLGVVTCEMAT